MSSGASAVTVLGANDGEPVLGGVTGNPVRVWHGEAAEAYAAGAAAERERLLAECRDSIDDPIPQALINRVALAIHRRGSESCDCEPGEHDFLVEGLADEAVFAIEALEWHMGAAVAAE